MQIRQVLPIYCVLVQPLDIDRKLSTISADMRQASRARIGQNRRIRRLYLRAQLTALKTA